MLARILIFCLFFIFPAVAAAQAVQTPSAAAIVCAYNSSIPILSDKNFGYVQCDQNGSLLISGITIAGSSFATSDNQVTGNTTLSTISSSITATNTKLDQLHTDNINAVASIAPVVSNGAVATMVGKGSGGTAYSVYATNLTATAGFLVGYDAASAPADGALTAGLVKDCIPLPANGLASINNQPGPGTYYTTGITYIVTSAATCYTKTTGTITAFISSKAL